MIAGLSGADPVQCSRKVVLKPDISLAEACKKVAPQPYGCFILSL